ncbi:hypothetical protein U3A58_18340 [Algoriphagus sp. C2-6-M1]|uniref:hypothetical protein n=1 Tax=Algoriphagus persicinus TaxID=3108754 RepID=UPI002B3F167D|nr:hypothetical protein [Algoriphagus sp. C2-6-M1]MEB2782355.1 hypothetical protein [Algoriphagus sp. C2-6-M1]
MKTNKPNQADSQLNKSTRKLAEEAEVTKEDLEALGPKSANLRDDDGDDEQLLQRKEKVDFGGEGLDVPGSELDDAQEKIGSEDEENNAYSQSNEVEKK